MRSDMDPDMGSNMRSAMGSEAGSALGRGRRERGIALIIVLWGLALVSILALTVASEGRTNLLVTRNLKQSAEARAAAEAGVHRALYEMFAEEEEARLLPSGAYLEDTIGRARYRVRILDETGRVDLNTVEPLVLEEILSQLAPEVDAAALVAAFVDYRDRDEEPFENGMEDPEYLQLDLAWDAKDRNFEHVLELEQIPGFSADLVARLLPHVTVYSRQRTLRETASLPSTSALLNGEYAGFDPNQPDTIEAPESFSGSRIYAIESSGEVGEARYRLMVHVVMNGGSEAPYQIVSWDETSTGYIPVTAGDLATIAR